MSFLRLFALCAVIGFASVGRAGVINATLGDTYPWVTAFSGSISFDATTGALDIVSYPEQFSTDGTPSGTEDLTSIARLFELHVIINPVTKAVSLNPAYSTALFVTGGGGSIVGDIFQSNAPTEFDFNLVNQGQIAFRFSQEGNLAVPGGTGVVVQAWTGGIDNFDSSFDSNFDNTGILNADIFAVPEPAMGGILVLVGAALLRRRK